MNSTTVPNQPTKIHAYPSVCHQCMEGRDVVKIKRYRTFILYLYFLTYLETYICGHKKGQIIATMPKGAVGSQFSQVLPA